MTKSERAKQLHEGGFNCAQSVVGVFCEDYGVELKTALRMAGALGGGLREGEVCGALSGGAMVVGLKYGQTEHGDLEQKQLCNEKIREFVAAFREPFGALTCRELLGVDLGQNPQALQQRPELKARCNDFIAAAVLILESLGY